ncbi:Uma2 family endonuclease [Sorangium sp. So ce1128]
MRAVPDWDCEILSPGMRAYDQIVKRRFYAEIGVRHLWYVDKARSFAVSRLVDGRCLELGVHGPTERILSESFEEVELDLSIWWEDLELEGD